MGVPAFFRWLSIKYPKIVSHCIEEKGKYIDENVVIPVDTSLPNPNDMEFDNLYLDMNGIIHPCTHPENKPAPKNEDEMFVEIFLYIDRIFSIVRPRKLMYMAVDGVAPRAKMNQQRSRRFRAAKEVREKNLTIQKIRSELLQKGAKLPLDPKQDISTHFDSNCITPGTPFMARLTIALQYYVYKKLHSDPGWRNIQVILSDANVPGEGEHKIMDYIRRQRNSPSHDPNTKHCLCGADADLIMLGLATHEPYFTIIREEFKPNQPRPCEICGQMNHTMTECEGLPSTEFNTGTVTQPTMVDTTEFIFIHLNTLREYLQRDLLMTDLPFRYDFERAIDDWVFMCFFVGNDFLPHLPSLEIREKAIDRLIEIYKRSIRFDSNRDRNVNFDGWLTNSGQVNMARVQHIMKDLAVLEDEIFKSRRNNEMDFRRRNRDRRKRIKRQRTDDDLVLFTRHTTEFVSPARKEKFFPGPGVRMTGETSGVNVKQMAIDEIKRTRGQDQINFRIQSDGGTQLVRPGTKSTIGNQSRKRPYKEEVMDEEDLRDEQNDKCDTIKLWEAGYRSRYYQSKFNVSIDDNSEFGVGVAHDYVRGLCWVLAYYYQGCISWKWYYPHHYAPFAIDFVDLNDLTIDFRTKPMSNSIDSQIDDHTRPFRPLEQLMGVFPADSRSHVPPAWQNLMIDPESPVIDLYPSDFQIDLNGKRYEWQGVALLPFVDEKRLLSALRSRYSLLTDEEQERNQVGNDRYFVRSDHPVADLIRVCYELDDNSAVFDPQLTNGITGKIWIDNTACRPGDTVKSPIYDAREQDIINVKVISCFYRDPQYGENFVFKARLLEKVVIPPPTLGEDAIKRERKHFDTKPMNRMVRHSLNDEFTDIGRGQGAGTTFSSNRSSNFVPPNAYGYWQSKPNTSPYFSNSPLSHDNDYHRYNHASYDSHSQNVSSYGNRYQTPQSQQSQSYRSNSGDQQYTQYPGHQFHSAGSRNDNNNSYNSQFNFESNNSFYHRGKNNFGRYN